MYFTFYKTTYSCSTQSSRPQVVVHVFVVPFQSLLHLVASGLSQTETQSQKRSHIACFIKTIVALCIYKSKSLSIALLFFWRRTWLMQVPQWCKETQLLPLWYWSNYKLIRLSSPASGSTVLTVAMSTRERCSAGVAGDGPVGQLRMGWLLGWLIGW